MDQLKPILFFLLCGFAFNATGQKLFWVSYADTQCTFTKIRNGDRVFKDSLPDGKYILYGSSKKDKYIEVDYTNGVKNGFEKYFYNRNFKLSEITEWKNGKRNGWSKTFEEGIGNYKYHFKNDTLDGKFNYYGNTGQFANGIKTGIWIYYDDYDEIDDIAEEKKNELINEGRKQKTKEILYINGFGSLLNAWDSKGRQVVKNGNTILHKPFAFSYLNGLKSGKILIKDLNSDFVEFEETYEKGELVKQTAFYPKTHQVKCIKNWTLTGISSIDTATVDVQTYVYFRSTTYKKNYEVKRNAGWKYFFKNGLLAGENEYTYGIKTGVWKWYYPDGRNRLTANYNTNEFLHFDSLGIQINSDFEREYLSILSDKYWFVEDSLDKDMVELCDIFYNNNWIFQFNLDGTVTRRYVSDHSFWDHKNWTYNLVQDKLYLTDPETDKKYNFLIQLNHDNKLYLKKILRDTSGCSPILFSTIISMLK